MILKMGSGKLTGNSPFMSDFARCDKIRGLIELMLIGIPVPETFVIHAHNITESSPQDATSLILHAINTLEEMTGLEIGRCDGDAGSLILVARSGEKRTGQALLPASILNLGDIKNMPLGVNVVQQEILTSEHQRPAICETVVAAVKNMARQITEVRNAVPWILLQRMRSGKAHGCSFSGAGYTRNPHTGAAEYYGRFAEKKTGEEYYRTPVNERKEIIELQSDFPEVLEVMTQYNMRIENYYKRPRYIEFVCENGCMFYLQNSCSRHGDIIINDFSCAD